MIENKQQEEVVTQDVDLDGGWIVEHHTLTSTWDVRIRIDSYQKVLDEKQENFDRAEKELNDARATVTEVQAQVTAASKV